MTHGTRIHLVDTADVYRLDWGGTGFGAVEEHLGRVLAAAQSLRMVLATKGRDPSTGPVRLVGSVAPPGVRGLASAARRRHDRPVPDLPARQVRPPDVAATLAQLRDDGKFREVGESNHGVSQVAALQAHFPFRLASNPFMSR